MGQGDLEAMLETLGIGGPSHRQTLKKFQTRIRSSYASFDLQKKVYVLRISWSLKSSRTQSRSHFPYILVEKEGSEKKKKKKKHEHTKIRL
jgi:hypothetical protein